jgi:predicted RNA-binding Zn ribbon-like protein
MLMLMTVGNHQSPEFPVLGEPVSIELANTLYVDVDGVVDFLATPALAHAWFASSPTASSLRRPSRWTLDQLEQLWHVRDAVAEICRATVDGRTPPSAAVASVNGATERAPRAAQLAWTADGPTIIDRVIAGSALDHVLAAFADDLVDVLRDPERLLVCANVDCQVLFVKQHHRRRWCHDGCGHRHRQAAYYRRLHP